MQDRSHTLHIKFHGGGVRLIPLFGSVADARPHRRKRRRDALIIEGLSSSFRSTVPLEQSPAPLIPPAAWDHPGTCLGPVWDLSPVNT